MPNRIIRESLVRSQRWLDLKDNQDRLAFILCVLDADDLGNFEAGPGDLVRLWRDIGVSDSHIAAKVARELLDHDLVRWYEAGGKRYGHIPRFRQRMRYVKRACPRPELAIECKEIRELLGKKTDHSQTTDRLQSDCRPPEVEVEVETEVEKNVVPQSAPVDNSARSWSEYWKAKGKALGIAAQPGEATGDYCRRIIATVKGE